MRCAKCGAKATGRYTSPLGETLCESCHVKINGMIVGGMAGGVGGAAAGPGILTWVRGALNPRSKRRGPDEAGEES